jgi:hypothetical protein
MDDFTPITEPEFAALLADAVASLQEPHKSTYERYRVGPFQQKCWRSELYGLEHVFVCARCDDAIIFFDDVEDEFASVPRIQTAFLRSWGLFVSCGQRCMRFPIPHVMHGPHPTPNQAMQLYLTLVAV